jgi:hypothetical protein
MTGTAFSPDFSSAEFGAATTATTTNWHTVESARDQWPDAPSDYGDDGDDTLLELLAVAKEAVLAYAPAVPVTEPPADPDVIPDGYRLAQLMQARNVWNSAKTSSSSDLDAGQYGISAGFPLDWQVRQLIRPKTGKPWIG